jgi:2-methylcitrate dehydratase PrpD
MPLQKSRFSSPVTHRKSFAAAAAAAAAEAARHRTKKGEVGTRSFEAPPLTFLSSLSSFEVEKGRERERESACSYNRENWTLNEFGKIS